MLNLIDYIKDDVPTIEGYIGKYGIPLSDFVGIDEYFKYWADCKKKLFHLLGGKLIYETPIEIEKSYELIKDDMGKLIDKNWSFFTGLRDAIDIKYIFGKDSTEESKIKDIFNEKFDGGTSVMRNMRQGIRCMCSVPDLCENQVSEDIFLYNYITDKKMKIQCKTKKIKSIKMIINFFDMGNETYYDTMNDKVKTFDEGYEEFRLKHSLVLNEKMLRGTLCLSIHPMDFMTMSDNSNGWSSCMSWSKDGCYHAGTVEMMNSNNVICVYLKGNDNYEWTYRDKTYSWNNKKWRQLFYVTKEIAVSGKSYPYHNKELTFIALEFIRDLAKKNWNHTYQYGIERYRDMIHINTYNKMVRNFIWRRDNETTKKNIIFHSKGMYNDMFNDNYYSYYCIRNKVKKNTIISYSGKCKCLGCKEDVLYRNYDPSDCSYDEWDENAYNDRYEYTNQVVCPSCYDKFICSSCDSHSVSLYKIKDKFFCERCLKSSRVFICPCCGEFVDIDHIEGEFFDGIYILHKDTGDLSIKDNLKDFYIKRGWDKETVDNKNFNIMDWVEDYKHKNLYWICKDCRKNIVTSEDLHNEIFPVSSWNKSMKTNIYTIDEDTLKKYILNNYKVNNAIYEDRIVLDTKDKSLEQFRYY